MNAILMVMVNNDILFIWIFPGELSSGRDKNCQSLFFPTAPKRFVPKAMVPVGSSPPMPGHWLAHSLRSSLL